MKKNYETILVPEDQNSMIEGEIFDWKLLIKGFKMYYDGSGDEDDEIFEVYGLVEDKYALEGHPEYINLIIFFPCVFIIIFMIFKRDLRASEYPRYTLMFSKIVYALLLQFPFAYKEYDLNLADHHAFAPFLGWGTMVVFGIILAFFRFTTEGNNKGFFDIKSPLLWSVVTLLAILSFGIFFYVSLKEVIWVLVVGGLGLFIIEIGLYSKNRLLGFLTFMLLIVQIVLVYWISYSPFYNALNFPYPSFKWGPLPIVFLVMVILSIFSIIFASCLPFLGNVHVLEIRKTFMTGVDDFKQSLQDDEEKRIDDEMEEKLIEEA